jgi:hypothetical protein
LTGQAAYQPSWTEPALTSTHCYRWRVQVSDVAGNTSAWITSGAIREPPFTVALVIVSCADPTNTDLWHTNTTGTVYWIVGMPLCVLPSTQPSGAGTDDTDPAHPLTAQASALTSFTLTGTSEDTYGSQSPWLTVLSGTIGQSRTADQPLKLRINRETSDANGVPYSLLTYGAAFQVGWFAQGVSVPTRTETLTVSNLGLRVIALNLGAATP